MHFPLKLYQLVQAGPPEIISWSDNGKSFLVVDADMFCNKILPKHFRHNKLTSFQRQLNLYGFQRIAKGTEAGRYYHALFDKNRPDRLSSIKREPRSGQANADNDDQGLSLTDDDGETSQTGEVPAPASASASRSRSRRSSVKEKPVVAGPEDHTAALAMINISRSLSSECLEAQNSIFAPSEDSCSSPFAGSSIVSAQQPSGTEIETTLKKSIERQSALEAEVVQLKSLVNIMMAKIENISPSTLQSLKLTSSAPLGTLSDSAYSMESLVQSSEDEEEKRRYESEEEEVSQNKRLKTMDHALISSKPLPLILQHSASQESITDTDSPGLSLSPANGFEQ